MRVSSLVFYSDMLFKEFYDQILFPSTNIDTLYTEIYSDKSWLLHILLILQVCLVYSKAEDYSFLKT